MKSDIGEMKKSLARFISEREWEKFHNAKDIAIALSVEASELLEIFEWKSPDEVQAALKEKREEIGSEVADILHFLIAFSNATGIDLQEEFYKKLAINEKRYPRELAKGRSDKYTTYQKAAELP